MSLRSFGLGGRVFVNLDEGVEPGIILWEGWDSRNGGPGLIRVYGVRLESDGQVVTCDINHTSLSKSFCGCRFKLTPRDAAKRYSAFLVCGMHRESPARELILQIWSRP